MDQKRRSELGRRSRGVHHGNREKGGCSSVEGFGREKRMRRQDEKSTGSRGGRDWSDGRSVDILKGRTVGGSQARECENRARSIRLERKVHEIQDTVSVDISKHVGGGVDFRPRKAREVSGRQRVQHWAVWIDLVVLVGSKEQVRVEFSR